MSYVLRYHDGVLAELPVPAPVPLRAVGWRPDNREALVVGNRGTVLRSDGVDFHPIATPTRANLRGVAYHPHAPGALMVGNHGTAVQWDGTAVHPLRTGERRHLRRVAWHPQGERALLVGNEGAAYSLAQDQLQPLACEGSNLRGVAWHPGGEYALVTANSYRGGFVPTPVLYRYAAGDTALESLVEGRSVDLIGVSWRPDGHEALIVGYDVIWHRAILYRFDGFAVGSVPYEEAGVYPTAVAWHPQGGFALVATASPYAPPAAGPGLILRVDADRVTRLLERPDVRFAGIEWRPDAQEAWLVGSGHTRTYTA